VTYDSIVRQRRTLEVSRRLVMGGSTESSDLPLTVLDVERETIVPTPELKDAVRACPK
jgi:hypothetical protein